DRLAPGRQARDRRGGRRLGGRDAAQDRMRPRGSRVRTQRDRPPLGRRHDGQPLYGTRRVSAAGADVAARAGRRQPARPAMALCAAAGGWAGAGNRRLRGAPRAGADGLSDAGERSGTPQARATPPTAIPRVRRGHAANGRAPALARPRPRPAPGCRRDAVEPAGAIAYLRRQEAAGWRVQRLRAARTTPLPAHVQTPPASPHPADHRPRAGAPAAPATSAAAAAAAAAGGPGKAAFVRAMFARIVPRYDLVNRLMTLGMDQRWRRAAVTMVAPQGALALDVATGTGDLALELLRQGARHVVGADFCADMLGAAVTKARPAAGTRAAFVAGDATRLPFHDDTFDCVVNGFMRRNVTDLAATFRELNRVLKPRGRLACLDL